MTLVFITNGSMTESQDMVMINSLHHLIENHKGCWKLWRNHSRPVRGIWEDLDKFCTDTEKSNWESCTVTCHDERVPEYNLKNYKTFPI